MLRSSATMPCTSTTSTINPTPAYSSRKYTHHIDTHQAQNLHRRHARRAVHDRLQAQRGPRQLVVPRRLLVVRRRRELRVCERPEAEHDEHERELVRRRVREARACCLLEIERLRRRAELAPREVRACLLVEQREDLFEQLALRDSTKEPRRLLEVEVAQLDGTLVLWEVA